ncbi:MAG: D-aminoacyl-tRNA deacylase [Pirellulales bacterium]
MHKRTATTTAAAGQEDRRTAGVRRRRRQDESRALADVGGEMLVVSQFTLLGDCRKGRRPSFTEAAAPADAERLYERFVEEAMRLGVRVATGTFRRHMQVALVNDGPVTLLLDTR